MSEGVRFFMVPVIIGLATATALIVILVRFRPESSLEASASRETVLTEQYKTQAMIQQEILREDRTWAKIDTLIDWTGARDVAPR